MHEARLYSEGPKVPEELSSKLGLLTLLTSDLNFAS